MASEATVGPVAQVVVGAVIVDKLERPSYVVAARRSRPAELAGKWEFPGGKVEDGETAEAALEREIREELDVEISVGSEVVGPEGGWPISEQYVLRLFLATVAGGRLHESADHDELRRLTVGELDSVDWLPSDRQALPQLTRLLAGRRPR